MTKYNKNDIGNAGKHDFDRNIVDGWNKTFSVGVFMWKLKKNGKELKKSKSIVRVSGLLENKEKVFSVAESIAKHLDNGTWDGRKTVSAK